MNIFTPSKLERDCIVVIGKESTGKSQLIAALTGQTPYSANFRGSTVTCDTYQSETYTDDTSVGGNLRRRVLTFIDTPGILYRSDSATTRQALRQLQENDTVLLVVKATDVDRDLADLLPLVADKRGIVVITFWDKVFSTVHNGQHAGKPFVTGLGGSLYNGGNLPSGSAVCSSRGTRPMQLLNRNELPWQPQTPCPPQQVVREWTETSNLSIVTVDARHLTREQKDSILASLQEPHPFPAQWIPTRAGWHIQPQPTLLEHPRLGWLLAIALLLIPAIIAVWGANTKSCWHTPFKSCVKAEGRRQKAEGFKTI